MITVAFEDLGDGRWIAADVYRRNLLHAVKQACGDEIRLCIVAAGNEDGEDEHLRSLGVDRIIRFDRPRRWSGRGLINAPFKRFAYADRDLGRMLDRQGIDALFGNVLLFKCPGVATLTWLPDFQHRCLPEMFDESERAGRDEAYLQSASTASKVVLLSDAVKEDFKKFAPQYAYKTRAVRPVTYLPEGIYTSEPLSIANLYHLPPKFVFMPNQFWRHKNHLAVFEAVHILKERGKQITIVCTGYPGDYRHNDHFANLWDKISRWNIREQVIYLGTIPREHLMQLIRQSICVLNPSFFEGWGMSVDEARSIGKQLVLSDIPAHREQNPPKAVFFCPENCEELAANLARIWTEGKAGPDPELEAQARENLPERVRATAEQFVSVCREALAEVSK